MMNRVRPDPFPEPFLDLVKILVTSKDRAADPFPPFTVQFIFKVHTDTGTILSVRLPSAELRSAGHHPPGRTR